MSDELSTTDGESVSSRAVRVARTGIALVHEGEIILPAAGSEAQAERVIEDSRTVVQYFFPVEIEIRGAEQLDAEEIVQQALVRLARSLENS